MDKMASSRTQGPNSETKELGQNPLRLQTEICLQDSILNRDSDHQDPDSKSRTSTLTPGHRLPTGLRLRGPEFRSRIRARPITPTPKPGQRRIRSPTPGLRAKSRARAAGIDSKRGDSQKGDSKQGDSKQSDSMQGTFMQGDSNPDSKDGNKQDPKSDSRTPGQISGSGSRHRFQAGRLQAGRLQAGRLHAERLQAGRLQAERLHAGRL